MSAPVFPVQNVSAVFSDDFQFIVDPSLKTKNVIVLFYRDGCGYCQMYHPHYEQAAKQDPNTVYLKVDTSNPEVQQKLASAYIKVIGVPTIASYHKGKFFSYLEGERTADSTIQYTMGIGRAPRFVRQ